MFQQKLLQLLVVSQKSWNLGDNVARQQISSNVEAGELRAA